MYHIPEKIHTWQLVADKETQKKSLIECDIPVPEMKKGDVLVKIAGCGICGTDISIVYENVNPVSRLPLTLGHEVSGTVIAGNTSLIGKNVVIPTILPCNECDLCKTGRGNRCLSQKMLGYSFGPYGGFASHIVVPECDLCVIPGDTGIGLPEMCVLADAVATPYQAALRSGLQKDDKVIIIGATGGLGIFMVQWAKALGAGVVVGIGQNDEKLKTAESFGLDLAINSKGKSVLDIKSELYGFCRKNRINTKCSWKIYEMSGTGEGQRLGLELLLYTSTLVIVGYGLQENTFNFSRLMAFDSEIIGTWGCPPIHYPLILNYILNGTIRITSLVETRPLGRIVESFGEIRKGRSTLKRIVLTPE